MSYAVLSNRGLHSEHLFWADALAAARGISYHGVPGGRFAATQRRVGTHTYLYVRWIPKSTAVTVVGIRHHDYWTELV